MKGRSVDNALHDVISFIEGNLKVKEFTMAAFLDIEIALNNVNLESIHAFLVSWIHKMLKSRSINQGGTPNGGILSLFFSNSLRRKTNTSQLSPFLWKESWRNCRAWKNRKVSVWTREKNNNFSLCLEAMKIHSLIESNGKITSILNIYFCRNSEWGHSNILLDAKGLDNLWYITKPNESDPLIIQLE